MSDMSLIDVDYDFGFQVSYASGRKRLVSGYDSYYAAVCAAEKYLCKKNVVECSIGICKEGEWSFA